ncbi:MULTISPECIES: hypothetical protein [Micromonospora]|uniref:hypothetical protein n=1 Tax=Micromonospora TaxID=1873 RepID=UPI000DC30F88|nr:MULTISPECIES: hypothetical protein [Micromonospora]RAO33213.1 hypothetical protein ONO86_05021 [Micromonospora noduli]RAO63895.1 hypothetical protein PSN01_00114 [Micromonospora saelicesensis]
MSPPPLLIRIGKGAGKFAIAGDVEADPQRHRAARPNDAVLGEEGGQRGRRSSNAHERLDEQPDC